MPKDYYAGELDLYVQGLREGRAQYSPDGMIAAGRAGIRAEGAVELLAQCAGQGHRPEQDLHHGVRDQGQRDALSSSFPDVSRAHHGCAAWRKPGIHTRRRGYGFGLARNGSRPGMTALILFGA